MSGDTPPIRHVYDAKAFALEGHLQLPLRAEIEKQAYLDLPENGGYLSQHTGQYRLGGIFSFRASYTQVAGNLDTFKPEHAYVSLATAVLEDFNILDVVTADRVVAQVSTRHPLIPSGPPYDRHIPDVTFLGTRFENLRIAGHEVKFDLNLDFFGSKPGNDAPWSSKKELRESVAAQYDSIRRQSDLPREIAERYNRVPSNLGPQESVECSLVQRSECSHPGVRTFGHVIDIPHFGRVYLATVRLVETPEPTGAISTLIRLTMIEAKLGCIANGGGSAGNAITNGGTKGGG
jgi:hypothetical protein